MSQPRASWLKPACRNKLRGLALSILIGLLVGFTHLLEPAELVLKVGRNTLNEREASGAIALVAIDDRSAADLGAPTWSGSQLALLVDRVGKAGARAIHVDAELPPSRDLPNLVRLEEALKSLKGRVSLPVRVAIDPITQQEAVYLPPQRLAQHAALVNTNLRVGWDGAIRDHPYSAPSEGHRLPSLASWLSGVDGPEDDLFPINYAFDGSSVPIYSASDLLGGRVYSDALAGRLVVIARTDLALERFWAPRHGPLPAGMIHILAAETLLAGKPMDLGWLMPLLIGALLATPLVLSRRRSLAAGSLVLALLGFLIIPVVLDQAQIFITVLPGLTVVVFAASLRFISSLRRSFHVRGTTNLVTGLPNLQALRLAPRSETDILVVARARNYAQITASLEPQFEKELVDQIVARLSFGTEGAIIYQLDEGVFVWIASNQSEDAVVQQIESLHALFRSPIVVNVRLIDLTMTFGLDLEARRPIIQRVPSALTAADSAAREGKRWASFNPASLEDAEWAMSLLARLDHAIDSDELWVAYQPKLDLRTGTIIGAEALVRWMHPEKGQIFPDQFIGAAEEGGRIDRLTTFVLDRALEVAASINSAGRPFNVAVNLSALLLTDNELPSKVEALLRKHGVAPHLLTLEVTETSTMRSAVEALVQLQRLADLGVQLSIDDYGTGFSTLDYLKRIPAIELKIDRSFISMLHKSQSDRIMVNSTIQLAHSLGRKVVAEGVESAEILSELRRMGCDMGQGYHIARPATLPQLLDILRSEGVARSAA